MNAESNTSRPRFSVFRNWACLLGAVIAVGSLFSFALLMTMDLFAREANLYMGILTFIIAPGFLILGMLVFGAGWLWLRRHHVKTTAKPFISLDFSRPEDRRYASIFIVGNVIFLGFAALGSYNSYHFVESEYFCGQSCHTPMNPVHVTYLNSPHAQIMCTACHVGPGAVSFVKAKLNGVHELIDTIRNSFERPIKISEHMRIESIICEQCHWPKKFLGNIERTYAHYLSDETNTLTTIQMLLKVGGGDPAHGPVNGIHWHASTAHQVEFIATDNDRQTIPWVRLTDDKGQVTVFRAKTFKDDPGKYVVHKMGCCDCHNRPAHQFNPPSDVVDVALRLGKIDASLALVKSNVVAVLSRTNYTAEAEALQSIAAGLRAAYPKESRVEPLITAAQQIYSHNFFPEMKADWRAYADNISHLNSPGCFRCHDGQHKTEDGRRKIEADNCTDCHLIQAQGSGAALVQLSATGLKFAHPDSSSEGTDPDCYTCHTGGP